MTPRANPLNVACLDQVIGTTAAKCTEPRAFAYGRWVGRSGVRREWWGSDVLSRVQYVSLSISSAIHVETTYSARRGASGKVPDTKQPTIYSSWNPWYNLSRIQLYGPSPSVSAVQSQRKVTYYGRRDGHGRCQERSQEGGIQPSPYFTN